MMISTNHRSLASILSLLAAVSLVSCSSALFREPEVRIQNVRLAGLGLQGGTLIFDVEVTNPNRFALNASELEYRLEIADMRAAGDTTWMDLATGTYDDDFSVAGGETRMVQVPVEFTYSGLGSAALSVMRAGTFTYRAVGSVDVNTPVGSREVPFRRQGMVTLLDGR